MQIERRHESILRDIFIDLYKKGKLTSPRGMKVLEIENYTYTLPPYVRFQNFKSRNYKLDYMKRELLWYIKGDRFDNSICSYAKTWSDIKNVDGSINSNYGQYIFGKTNQFDNVVNLLKGDKDTRRASITILNSDHLLSDTKDVPCTYSLNFRIRENKLNMTVHMRSQDAVWGMGNDAPIFSIIHEMIYCSLLETYSYLEHGNYVHFADSFHIYERHFDLLTKITQHNDEFVVINCPKISSPEEVKFMRALNFENIPENFEFTKWLNEVNKT